MQGSTRPYYNSYRQQPVRYDPYPPIFPPVGSQSYGMPLSSRYAQPIARGPRYYSGQPLACGQQSMTGMLKNDLVL